MGIDIGTDEAGHSLRLLVRQALDLYSTNNLWQFLHDNSSIVRTMAARKIQTTNPNSETLERVIVMTGSKSWQEREISTFILGQLGTPRLPYRKEAIPIIEKMCADKVSEVRATALSALGHLRAKESIPVIRHAQQDTNPEVREMASYVLETFTE